MKSPPERSRIPRVPGVDPRVSLLVSALMSTAAHVRIRARRALVALGRSTVPELIALLSNRRKQIRWEAAKSLAEIADPGSAPDLVRALEDPDSGVRWVAAEGLIAIGDASLRALLEALSERSDSLWLREGAHHVLYDISRTHSLESLESVMRALSGLAPAEEVPTAAERALRELNMMWKRSVGKLPEQATFRGDSPRNLPRNRPPSGRERTE